MDRQSGIPIQPFYVSVFEDYSFYHEAILNKLMYAEFNYWTIRAEIYGLLTSLFGQDG